jgi:hypothetical protein
MTESNGTRRALPPIPDPTVLTTQQLQREIMALREILEARLAGNDKLAALLQAQMDQKSSYTNAEVGHLRTEHEEKFKSIATQFTERDIRTEQTARDSKVAVDAALQAQKEAAGAQNESNAASISKSEAAFTKQIDQIGVIINTTTKGTDEKIEDIKTRITQIEGRSAGHGETWGYVIGAIGLMIGLASVIMMVMRLTPH